MKKICGFILVIFLCTIGLTGSGYAQEPQRGGVLKVIMASGPQSFYMPEGGPADLGAMFPAIDGLMQYDGRELKPFLAESVDIDEQNLTITFHLRKGVKYHDGSELDAEGVKWGFDFTKEKGRLQYGDRLKSVEVVDKYTVRLHLTEYNNQLIHSYGYRFPLCKNSYTTQEVSYLRTHVVGTGPFILKEWVRDSHMIWEKNPNYWQKGKPYLDRIEIRYIPDSVTARAILEAGEADIWSGATINDQKALEKKGFIRKAGYTGFPSLIMPNLNDPKRPTANPKVRMAIEYAIDRPAIAKAIGFGYYEPLKMTAPSTEWGYDPDYKGRPYNPEMARKLLTEAGYPKGLKLKLLAFAAFGGGQAAAEAIQRYCADVGIVIDVDMADPGRFWGSMFGTGWEDLLLGFTGLDPNYLVTFQRWFSHDPATNLASFKRSDALIALSKKSITYGKEADQIASTGKLVRQIADEASMIPLWHVPLAVMITSRYHCSYTEEGFLGWRLEDDWLEK